MSYLEYPRIHFSGRFQADPSTINNDPKHFDTDTFVPRYQQPEAPSGLLSSWNPRGSAAFRLDRCVVTGVVGTGTGGPVRDPGTDPLVGGALRDTDQRVSAKIVDLDPYQQASSEIYGLRLRLFDHLGRPVLSGDFVPTAFADFWLRYPQATNPAFGGTSYQSVLDNVEFFDVDSPVARELRAGTSGDRLSIKINVDGYDPDATSSTFTWGRIVGTIGCHRDGEPYHVLSGRRLRRQAGAPLQHAQCRLDRSARLLHLDLGNSIPTDGVGGSLAAPGPLHVALLPTDAEPRVVATLDDLDDNLYHTAAGIVSVPLTESEASQAVDTPIGLLTADRQVLLAEAADGSCIQADTSIFRIYPEAPGPEPSTKTEVTFHATRFGEPAGPVEIRLSGAVIPPPTNGPPPAPPSLDAPSVTPGLRFDQSVWTDGRGRATLVLAAGDPGSPRPNLDGQVYAVSYGPARAGAAPEGQLSVLVWEHHPAPGNPDWVTDVQPVFARYANLYPVMRDILDLSNYHDVIRYREWITTSLTAPVRSPSHMPVTRDLSPGRRDAIVGWLREEPPPFLRVRDRADLHRVLQQALRLEHATVPAYLTALFSLKPGRNLEVARIIRSVVLQEMLHMALVANIINALGGEPDLDPPGFLPRYPGQLPGGVLPNLVVSLRRCSIEQVRDVFMAIEQPDEPINTESLALLAPVDPGRIHLDTDGSLLGYGDEGVERCAEHAARLREFFQVAEYPTFTIGWFYRELARALSDLEAEWNRAGETLFVGDPARQVVWPNAPGHLYRVTDLDTALWSIYEIIHQGEGTPDDPTGGTGGRGELAHYYRFREIVEGRQLIRRDGRWVYEGPAVPFDPDGVHPMVDDPDTAALPPGSRVRAASELCDRVYRDLLVALGQVFGGQPAAFGPAVSLMFSLEVQAKRLLELPSAPGAATVAGPSFQVPPDPGPAHAR